MKLAKEIAIKVEGKTCFVRTKDYITAKTKQLQEFGYSNLTEAEVEEQIKALAEKRELTVIGMMMEGEVLV